MRRVLATVATVLAALVVVAGPAAGPAAACAGLIGRNGSVNLVRTTTLAAYHQGNEHYVTSFQFAGGGGAFGSIVPLPGVPTNVEKGGAWTLQRLQREVQPPLSGEAVRQVGVAAAAPAEVLRQVRIDALDLTVLRGGGAAVGDWARQNGFNLPPDAPEVLDFYASRSPVFLAARFDPDAARARGQQVGDGTPVHLTIPTANPWVPLRILGLGHRPDERVQADVFLLTDGLPALVPGDTRPGLSVERQQAASASLLRDLRSDQGMEWVPPSMVLTHLTVDSPTAALRYDLAVDATGRGRPSLLAAGLARPAPPAPNVDRGRALWLLWPFAAGALALVAGAAAAGVAGRRLR